MNRTPPIDVRRELRKEVGFGCPVPGCGNPYLYWHHFDPPWHEREHHDPGGMIALCGEHHPKADAGAYTVEQLQRFKIDGRNRVAEVRGRFEWMRREILAVVGGNFYLETPIIFQFRNEPAIWFNRDEDGYMLLNFRMLTTSGEPRVRLEDNWWLPRGNPDDLECPPNGKLLRISYANGDSLRVEFLELAGDAEFLQRYPESGRIAAELRFPITAVELTQKVAGTNIEFGPRESRLGGAVIRNSFMRNNRVGIHLN